MARAVSSECIHEFGPRVLRAACQGFNSGHSAAVWLASNPHITVHTFDLFESTSMARSFDVLNRTFPSRLHAHRGDSLTAIPSLPAPLEPPCSLVHVDGRHDYLHTVADAVQLARHARPHALYLFDDQCDVSKCDATSFTPLYPTIATCELERAAFMAPIERRTQQVGTRGWAVFELLSTITPVTVTLPTSRQSSGGRALSPLARIPVAKKKMQQQRVLARPEVAPLPNWVHGLLPCVPLCRLSLNRTSRAAGELYYWWRKRGAKANASLEKLLLREQNGVRPVGCVDGRFRGRFLVPRS
jgi:hypothetical protein